MEVIQAIQGKGLVQFMREIQAEGEEFAIPFPIEKEGYLRNQASSTLKYEFPDRKYKVTRRPGKVWVYWERRVA